MDSISVSSTCCVGMAIMANDIIVPDILCTSNMKSTFLLLSEMSPELWAGFFNKIRYRHSRSPEDELK